MFPTSQYSNHLVLVAYCCGRNGRIVSHVVYCLTSRPSGGPITVDTWDEIAVTVTVDTLARAVVTVTVDT